MTEAERLNARLKQMAAEDGLVHFVVSLRKTDDATVEDVCAEVNQMLDSYERGETQPLVFNDGRGARA